MIKEGSIVFIKDSHGNIITSGQVDREFKTQGLLEPFFHVKVFSKGNPFLEIVPGRLLVEVGNNSKTPAINLTKRKQNQKTHKRFDGVEVHSETGIPIDEYVDFSKGIKL